MSDEKTEEPSDSKLRKAREKGQVPKSQDAAIAASTLAVVITLHGMAEGAMARLRAIVHLGLDFGRGDPELIELARHAADMALQALLITLPLMIVGALFAALGLLSHVGLVIAMEAVAPKPEAIDPMAGIKKIFSVKSLLHFLQMVFKAVVLGATLWMVITALLPMIGGSVYQSVDAIRLIAGAAIGKVLAIAAGLFVVLAPLDYGIQRWQFMKDQRMSKDEVKREYKSEEGDPLVKGQRMQLARELAREDPKKTVAGASAVVVNPIHYAVALRYVAEEAGLPVVVAKGVDQEALHIRACAEGFGVPVFSNPPLARALYKVPQGQAIPQELFAAVAAVLRWVDDLGERPGRGGPA
jgi:type III secretion protein U